MCTLRGGKKGEKKEKAFEKRKSIVLEGREEGGESLRAQNEKKKKRGEASIAAGKKKGKTFCAELGKRGKLALLGGGGRKVLRGKGEVFAAAI